MTNYSRRGFLGGGAVALLLAGCENTVVGNGVGGRGAAQIDARVSATRDYLFSRYPGTRDLAGKAYGVLYMPLVTEAGFGIGGGYGLSLIHISDPTRPY